MKTKWEKIKAKKISKLTKHDVLNAIKKEMSKKSGLAPEKVNVKTFSGKLIWCWNSIEPERGEISFLLGPEENKKLSDKVYVYTLVRKIFNDVLSKMFVGIDGHIHMCFIKKFHKIRGMPLHMAIAINEVKEFVEKRMNYVGATIREEHEKE